MTKKSLAAKTKLANAAFKQAAEKVIELAERTSTPVILWENGAIKEVDPKTLRTKARKTKGKKDAR